MKRNDLPTAWAEFKYQVGIAAAPIMLPLLAWTVRRLDDVYSIPWVKRRVDAELERQRNP